MYATFGQHQRQMASMDERRFVERNGTDVVVEPPSKKQRGDFQKNYNFETTTLLGSPPRILGRRYQLTKTAYKYLDVAIAVDQPSYVDIVIGDHHGRQISLSRENWRELLDRQDAIVSCFDRDEPRSPMTVGHLTLRFGKINNLLILRMESPRSRIVMSKDTLLRIYTLQDCVTNIADSLHKVTAKVDDKLRRFRAIAADVSDRDSVQRIIRDNEDFNRTDLVDCELLALLFD